MRVLVACEESQAVTVELRRLGHEAYSCDILPSSGGHPEWHIQGDCIPLINGHDEWKAPFPIFRTSDGFWHDVPKRWDMILAFPPCTHLCSAGQRWFSPGPGQKDPKLREDAAAFFIALANANCDKIAIENPVGIMSTRYRRPDQKIQPWQFGHAHSKTTCLWLKGLPPLKPTDILTKPEDGWENQGFTQNGKYAGFKNYDEEGKLLAWNDPRTAVIRSKTYPGIARAMAEQWAGQAQTPPTDSP